MQVIYFFKNLQILANAKSFDCKTMHDKRYSYCER